MAIHNIVFRSRVPPAGDWLPSYRPMTLNALKKPLEEVSADVSSFLIEFHPLRFKRHQNLLLKESMVFSSHQESAILVSFRRRLRSPTS